MKIFDLYQKLFDDDFSFAYLDQFTDNATDALIAIQDARLANDRKSRKKVSFLITECFQNVVRHGIKTDYKFDKLFGLRSQGSRHSIVTVNPIEMAKKSELEKNLKEITHLSKEELKQVYLNSLNGNDFSVKGGAGLGLIEMARKTNEVPAFSFKEISDDLTAFKIELTLKGKEESGEQPERQSSMGDLFDSLQAEKTLLLQKGDFSQDSVVSLFELIEDNLNNTEGTDQTKKLYLLIELLQNMSINAIEVNGTKTGIFQIKLDGEGKLIFETGNCIKTEDCNALQERLDEILKFNKIEILKKYNTELRKGLDEESENHSGGIGLLEISKLTAGNFRYEIEKVTDKISFITLSATMA